eukprot:UN34686
MTFHTHVKNHPCESEYKLIQRWESCGFGCAAVAYVQQILHLFFYGKTYAISRSNVDYERFFGKLFKDDVFPICDDEDALDNMAEFETMHPKYFHDLHVHSAENEELIRILYHEIFVELWDNLQDHVTNQLNLRLQDVHLPDYFTTFHVRRGDKCMEEFHHLEARCFDLPLYIEQTDNLDQTVFFDIG